MLNNHLIEVYNADSIHNGPIFDPQDHAQRPQNGCLRTCCGSVTATNPPKTWYHCTVVCFYDWEAIDSLVEYLNVDNIHNGPIFDPLDSAQRPWYWCHKTYCGLLMANISQPKLGATVFSFCLHIMWRLNDSITAGMYVERWYSKEQSCQAKEGLFQRVPQQTA